MKKILILLLNVASSVILLVFTSVYLLFADCRTSYFECNEFFYILISGFFVSVLLLYEYTKNNTSNTLTEGTHNPHPINIWISRLVAVYCVGTVGALSLLIAEVATTPSVLLVIISVLFYTFKKRGLKLPRYIVLAFWSFVLFTFGLIFIFTNPFDSTFIRNVGDSINYSDRAALTAELEDYNQSAVYNLETIIKPGYKDEVYKVFRESIVDCYTRNICGTSIPSITEEDINSSFLSLREPKEIRVYIKRGVFEFDEQLVDDTSKNIVVGSLSSIESYIDLDQPKRYTAILGKYIVPELEKHRYKEFMIDKIGIDFVRVVMYGEKEGDTPINSGTKTIYFVKENSQENEMGDWKVLDTKMINCSKMGTKDVVGYSEDVLVEICN